MSDLSDGDASIDEDELLEALEEEEEEEGASDESEAPGSEGAARKQSLESLGGDLLLRIMGMLSVAQLCTLSGRARPWFPALRPAAGAPHSRPRGAASSCRAPLRHPSPCCFCGTWS